MKKVIPGMAALAAIVAIGSIAAPVVHASSTVTIRESDLITGLSATRSAGHVAFRADGLRVWTDDSTSQAKAAEYFELSGGLPTSASLEWYGTNPQPGQQIVFDADGIDENGNDYNILVGEPVYGDNWWLTNGSSDAAKAVDPSGGENGGNGTEWFGTLADWADALPDARVYAGGFSLGSGVKGDGVIDSITYDDTTYRFTKEPAAPAPTVVDVDGTESVLVRPHSVRIDLRSDAKPENSVLGERLAWKITVDGKVEFRTRQGFDDHDIVRQHFADGSGRHVLKVFKNGELVRKVVARF